MGQAAGWVSSGMGQQRDGSGSGMGSRTSQAAGRVSSVQLRTGSEIVFLIRLKLCACYISPSMFGNTG